MAVPRLKAMGTASRGRRCPKTLGRRRSGRAVAPALGIIMTGRNLGVLIGPMLLAQAFKATGTWDLAAPIFGTVTTLALALGIYLAISLRGARYGTNR